MTANAATFDGTTPDFLDRDGDLDGNSDSKLWTGSLWFERADNGVIEYLHHSGGAAQEIFFLANDTIRIAAKNSSLSSILSLATSAISDTSWHHLLFSVDLSDTGKRHLYIDDASDLSVTIYTNDTIDFTRPNHAIGATITGSAPFPGCLAEVWIAPGVYIDFSVKANRRKFISANGAAVYLGPDGSFPTGTPPLMYFANPFGSFETNLGSGGGFTLNGALADCTGPAGLVPPAGVIAAVTESAGLAAS